MFSFKKHKSLEEKTFICLDVGTEFLKLIVFSIHDRAVVIDEYLKTRQHAAAMKNGTVTSIRRVIETVQESMLNLKQKKFDGAIMGIAGELVKGVMVEAKYTRNDPSKPIDAKELDVVSEKILDEAYREAEHLVFTHIGDTTGELTNIEMLNHIVVDAHIDGFRVEDPMGMTGTDAKIKFYFTFAPVLHVNYLKSITDTIGVNLLGIIPQPFAVAMAINGARDSAYSSIVIDVGGGTTDIAVIQNGVTVGTHMIAFGGRVFTKRIASDLKLTVNEAEEFKIKYTTKDLVVSRISDVKDSVQKDVSVWAFAVFVGLEEFIESVKGFPHRMYLCGGGSMLTELKDALVEFPWTKELPFNRSPKISYLEPKDLSGIVDDKKLLISVEDVTPASIARFTLELIE
ncbi:MAG: cell division FtsA domain-containing protein [Candidatus Dojkabacteria bacterium]